MSYYPSDFQYDELLALYDGEKKIEIQKMIDESNKTNTQRTAKYKERIAMKAEVKRIKEEAPAKVLKSLMDFQGLITMLYASEKIDDETLELLENAVCDPHGETDMFSCFTELMAVCEYSEVQPIRENNTVAQRLTRAQILARATDPADRFYIMCSRCNRPVSTKHLKKHQEDTSICQEIKLVKFAVQDKGKAISQDIGKMVARALPLDDGGVPLKYVDEDELVNDDSDDVD